MEVVNDFKQSCPSFFIRNPKNQNGIIIPTIFKGPQYKQICQRWQDEYRFATVYDTENRIPVYSAYTFFMKEKTERREFWKIEPQLETIKEYKDKREMMRSPTEEDETVRQITHQAVVSDYNEVSQNYTRGHVFPCSFAADQKQADSTFTLTNIAPQKHNSNQEWATQVEMPMRNEIIRNCRLDQNHKAYIVTGVVPGNTWLSITRQDKVYEKGINIPSHFWSAFCCTSKKDIKNLITKAYIAEHENFKVMSPSIDNLNKRLTGLYGQDFSVFPGLPVEHIEPPFSI